MPNFVQIWWAGFKCRAQIWFVGSNLVDFGLFFLAAILDFAINEKFLCRLVWKVRLYVHAISMSKSDERDSNAEQKCDLWGDWVKFGRFWTFDHWRPSWILQEMRNSGTGLFEGSSCMSMPTFVQIWLMGSKCRAEMWFVGWQASNLVDFRPLTPGSHLEFYDKWEILAQTCF